MLLQYRHNDLNRDNHHFNRRAKDQQHESDYPEDADKTDHESRWVLAAEMMLREILHFRQPNVHTVLIINIFKYMAFLHMQESIRGDRRQEEKAAKEVQLARNYQVSRDFNPDDPSQPISTITHTPPSL